MRFPWQPEEQQKPPVKTGVPAHMFFYASFTHEKVKVHDSSGQVLPNPLPAVKGKFPRYHCNKEHAIIITDKEGTVLAKRGPCLPTEVP